MLRNVSRLYRNIVLSRGLNFKCWLLRFFFVNLRLSLSFCDLQLPNVRRNILHPCCNDSISLLNVGI